MAARVERLAGFAPVIDRRSRVLILGSFPSIASLAARQYYAHPQNQFWRVLGAILDRPLKEMPYAARLKAVKSARIAIWDIYATCRREGSLDSAIHAGAENDLAGLRALAPALRRVCFNGRTAAKRLREVESLGYEAVVLPSTSPAHAGMSFEDKLARWRAALVG